MHFHMRNFLHTHTCMNKQALSGRKKQQAQTTIVLKFGIVFRVNSRFYIKMSRYTNKGGEKVFAHLPQNTSFIYTPSFIHEKVFNASVTATDFV